MRFPSHFKQTVLRGTEGAYFDPQKFREPERAKTHTDTHHHPEELQAPAGRSAQGKAEPSSPPHCPPFSTKRRSQRETNLHREPGGGKSKARKTQPYRRSPQGPLLREEGASARPTPCLPSSPSVKGVGREAVLHGRAELVAHLRPEVRVTSGGQHPGDPAQCCLTAKWRPRSRKLRFTALGRQRPAPLICSGGRRARRCRLVPPLSAAPAPASGRAASLSSSSPPGPFPAWA